MRCYQFYFCRSEGEGVRHQCTVCCTVHLYTICVSCWRPALLLQSPVCTVLSRMKAIVAPRATLAQRWNVTSRRSHSDCGAQSANISTRTGAAGHTRHTDQLDIARLWQCCSRRSLQRQHVSPSLDVLLTFIRVLQRSCKLRLVSANLFPLQCRFF